MSKQEDQMASIGQKFLGHPLKTVAISFLNLAFLTSCMVSVESMPHSSYRGG